jgi:uncharacterized protein (TIGR00251 family)
VIRQTGAGVEIDVRVIPRARKTEISGTREGALLVRLAAPPVEGAANDTLVRFFSALLHVPQRAVRIASGAHSRLKRVGIDGVTAEAVRKCLS